MQDLFGSEPAAHPKVQVAPTSEAETATAAAEADTEGLELNLCLDTEAQAEQPVQLATCMQVQIPRCHRCLQRSLCMHGRTA